MSALEVVAPETMERSSELASVHLPSIHASIDHSSPKFPAGA
jgi:hypothetical protein